MSTFKKRMIPEVKTLVSLEGYTFVLKTLLDDTKEDGGTSFKTQSGGVHGTKSALEVRLDLLNKLPSI